MFRIILFYYCFLLAIVLSVTTRGVYRLLFLPLILYFGIAAFEHVFRKKSPSDTPARWATTIATLLVCMTLLSVGVTGIYKKVSRQTAPAPSPSSSPTNAPSPTPSRPFVIIKDEYKNDTINIRITPSTKGKIIGRIDNQTRYPVIQTVDSWIEIQIDKDTSGFVNDAFVTTTP